MDTITLTTPTCCGDVTFPVVVSDTATLVAEACTNAAVDPDELVTMSFGLRNGGSANTTNLVAILQARGGVTAPSGPQVYGMLAAGGDAVDRPFTFVASGPCGGTITATLRLQEGTADLGTVAFVISLGRTAAFFTQNFDSVTAPASPAGWTTSVSGAQFAGHGHNQTRYLTELGFARVPVQPHHHIGQPGRHASCRPYPTILDITTA